MSETQPVYRIEDAKRLAKLNKYRAERMTVDGITFASRREARRYQVLKIAEKGGVISELCLQPRFGIEVAGKKIAVYFADFAYLDEHGKRVIEDAKSPATAKNALYRLKKKLVEALYDIKITEV